METGSHGDLSGEAAGVVRGVSKSIVRAPFVGRLPKAAPKPPSTAATRGLLKRRVPVRRVARVSDKVSTGLEWYTSALEAKTETDHNATSTATTNNTTNTTTTAPSQTQQWLLRTRFFAWNLFRNTLLGMAVFEAYGTAIGTLAGPTTIPETDSQSTASSRQHLQPEKMNIEYDNDTVDDDEELFLSLARTDAYSRASLPAHFFSGSIAGTIHGLASSLMEGNTTAHSMTRYTAFNTIHHSMAHAMLFGSYETIKRTMLQFSDDEERLQNRAYYLVTLAFAGGLAGQIQHMASHYVEAGLGLSNHTLQMDWRSTLSTPMAIRPLLWAFPPSAIGFVAFEYGKEFMT